MYRTWPAAPRHVTCPQNKIFHLVTLLRVFCFTVINVELKKCDRNVLTCFIIRNVYGNKLGHKNKSKSCSPKVKAQWHREDEPWTRAWCGHFSLAWNRIEYIFISCKPDFRHVWNVETLGMWFQVLGPLSRYFLQMFYDAYPKTFQIV